jgi:hypothetical protein
LFPVIWLRQPCVAHSAIGIDAHDSHLFSGVISIASHETKDEE